MGQVLSYVALRHRGPIALPRDCSENVASLQLRHSLKDFSSVRRTVTDMRSRLNENTVEAVELPSLGSACSFFTFYGMCGSGRVLFRKLAGRVGLRFIRVRSGGVKQFGPTCNFDTLIIIIIHYSQIAGSFWNKHLFESGPQLVN